MQIPIPQPIVDTLGTRLWDGIVQAFADELHRRGRPDWAQRVEKLRVHPDLPKLMRAAVVEGWNFWLDNSHDRRLAEAARAQAPSLTSTLVSLGGRTVGDPLQRTSVESTFAEWFASLHAGATPAQCEEAAHDLLQDIFKAAQQSRNLQPYVAAALMWDVVERPAQPKEGTQVAAIKQLAQAEAKRERCEQYTTAHMLYALAAREPKGQVQMAFERCGLSAAQIVPELEQMGLRRRRDPADYEPGKTTSIDVMVDQARALAEQQDAKEIDDMHLAVAAVLLAEDTQCKEGHSLRLVFNRLHVSTARLLEQLSARATWPTLEDDDPGALLTSRGL